MTDHRPPVPDAPPPDPPPPAAPLPAPLPGALALRRVDPARNMARFYALSVEPTLFGGADLVRRWGRIGGAGREKREAFPDAATAAGALARLAARKRRRGYR